MPELDAVILAAGLSRRMGRNKLLLPLGNATVFGQLLANFPFTQFYRVIVVLADREVERIAETFPVCVCRNEHPEAGKSSSIRLGLDAGDPEHGVMFSVADQPLLSGQTVIKLVEVFRSYPENIVLPTVHHAPASPAIFPAKLRAELQGLRGDEGGRKVIQRHPALVRAVPFFAPEEFLDIDTDSAYQDIAKRWDRKIE